MSKGNSTAINSLLETRQSLINQRVELVAKLDSEILQIDTAIELLSGKKVWEIAKVEKFDDENTDYIKSSIEN